MTTARVRLDRRALRLAGVPTDAALLLRLDAWESDVDLPESAPDHPEYLSEGLALISVEGPLSKSPDTLCAWYDGYGGEDGIAARFERALAAPETRAVLIYFESPGGTSAGLEEAIGQMCAARDAAGKPVVGFVDQACSAAIWIAAAVCDGGLYGTERAEAGSIGSYVAHCEESKALEKEGLTVTLIADPPGKVAGNPYEPLSDLGRERIDRGVKACTARFVDAIEASLGIPAKELRALDGDVLEGVDAVEFGLLDGIADLQTTASLALALADERATKDPP